MSVILRASPTEHLLRSVGDHPGIIGAGWPTSDGPMIYSHPGWTPSTQLADAAAAAIAAGQGGVLGETTIIRSEEAFPGQPIDVDDAVNGCEAASAVVALLSIVVAAVVATTNAYAPAFAFEQLEEMARWAGEVRAAAAKRLQELQDA